MSATDRRGFLKRAAVAAGAIGGSAGCDGDAPEGAQPTDALDALTLRSIGALALPSQLGAEGVQAAVAEFQRWVADFEPVAELAHAYGSDEIRYGGPDPAPRWRSQLEALELESQRRRGVAFVRLAPEEQRAILVREIAREDGGMPEPQDAQHVATALVAHFYASSAALDLCYGARIERYACRGLASAPQEPAPLTARD